MNDVGVKETSCTRCAHREVCIYKHDYQDVLKAVKNAAVMNTVDGKIVSKKIIYYDFIGEIFVRCKYYQTFSAQRYEGYEEAVTTTRNYGQ